MRKLNIFIIASVIVMIMLVGNVSAAMTAHQREIYDQMDFINKIKYALQKGLFIFTTWGQVNYCATDETGYNDETGDYVGFDEKWSYGNEKVDCDDSDCGYDRCAIDSWAEKICLGGQCSRPSSPTYNDYVGEENGDGAEFRGYGSNEWYYSEIYCCPKDVPGALPDHDTKVYVCEDNEWDYKGRYDLNENCNWEDGPEGCWCVDEDDDYYVDENGGFHCREDDYSKVVDGTWCPNGNGNGNCPSNPNVNIPLGLSDCTYQGGDFFTTSELPKTIITSSTEQKEYMVYKRCKDSSEKWISSTTIDTGLIDKGNSKTFSSYAESVNIYIRNYQCDEEQICGFIGSSCTKDSDCCDYELLEISCENSKCTWDDVGASCSGQGGTILAEDWVCDGEIVEHDNPPFICCVGASHYVVPVGNCEQQSGQTECRNEGWIKNCKGRWEDIGQFDCDNYWSCCKLGGDGNGDGNGNGGHEGVLTMTWTEFYSTSNEDISFFGVFADSPLCSSDSECPSLEGYNVKCDKSSSVKKRIWGGRKEFCEDLGPGGLTGLVVRILNLVAGKSFCDTVIGTWESIDKAFVGEPGMCMASSTTWYGKLWEGTLKTVGGFGLPAQYVVIITIMLLITIIGMGVRMFT